MIQEGDHYQQYRYYGKYRGTVTDWVDPDKMGRIQVRLENIYGTKETGPAYPCTPYAGKGVGFMFVPPKGAHVWVEFEDGDPSKPIYSGCFWNTSDEVPTDDNGDDYSYPDSKMIKTPFATMIFDAKSTGEKQKIVIKTNNTKPKSKITISEKEIVLELEPSTIRITSSSVTVNESALEITNP
jgi:uncharacterized protein involved in type VI secretion and phage assembly